MQYPYPFTKWDEYHIHQTSDVLTVPLSADPSFVDHACMWGHAKGPGPYFYIAFYTSPNTGVRKACAAVNYEGKQYQIRAVQESFDDPTLMEIGPMSETIDEPLWQRSARLAPNDYLPVSFEVTGRGPFPIVDMGIDHGLEPPRTGMGMHWYSQLLRFTGHIEIEGKTFDADGFVGERDRGWGVTGPTAQTTRSDLGFWLYLVFDDFGLLLFYSEGADTVPIHCHGGLIYPDGSMKLVRRVIHDLEFQKDTRLWTKYDMELGMENGDVHTLSCKRVGEWNSFAGWSMRPTRNEEGKVIAAGEGSMGSARMGAGPLVIESDIIDRTDLEFLHNVARASRETPCEATFDGDIIGYGVVEESVGKRSQYGWQL